MAKEMLINVSEGEECRIALLENGKLEELYMERTSSTSHVGNIYKGRVTNVEASIQAAFVDFGLGRNGFLHISDLMPQYFGKKGEDIHEAVGRKMARHDRPPIQKCLRRGDDITVQIIKEGIGTKGPTLSTYVSIPGRILVMMPGMNKMGISKKIEDEEERRRLRTILDSLKPPKGVGFIIRTAGVGRSKTEIQRDLTYLSRLWAQIEKLQEKPAPVELYTEGDLVTRTVRDVYTTDVEKIVADSKEVVKRVKEVIKLSSPRAKNKVELYEETMPLFHKYGIEAEIEQMYSRHVPLPSGGSLVIDSTEAIVAIDVNSGKFRDHADAETTAYKTDMEAADEIPRQLRLRDLGGVIICDFIDLRYERHRREVEERLHQNLSADRAKTKMLRMSQFGIIELTRQRMRPSLKRSIYFDCPHCKGGGLVKTPESMSIDVMRRLAIGLNDLKVARVELAVGPEVAFYLLNRRRVQLAGLEEATKKSISIRSDPSLGLDEQRLALFDARDGLVVLPQLASIEGIPHTTQLNTRPTGASRHRPDDRRPAGRGGRDGDQRGRGRGGRGGSQPREEERFEIEDGEAAVEAREREDASVPAEPIDPAKQPATSEPENDVVDVEDGGSEIGDRPPGEFERYDRGNRNNRGGSGGGNRDRNQRGGRGGGGGRDRGRDQRDNRGGPRDSRDRDNRGQRPQRPDAAPMKPAIPAEEVAEGEHDEHAGEEFEGEVLEIRNVDASDGGSEATAGVEAPGDVAAEGESDAGDDAAGEGEDREDNAPRGEGPGSGPQGRGGRDDEEGQRRRRRRGGRRHRRRRENQEQAGGANGQPSVENRSNSGLPPQRPVQQQGPRPQPQPRPQNAPPRPVPQQVAPPPVKHVHHEDDKPEPGNELNPPPRATPQRGGFQRRGGGGFQRGAAPRGGGQQRGGQPRTNQRYGNDRPNNRPPPNRVPPPQNNYQAPRPQNQPPPPRVERTGSTDKHLASDEPVAPPSAPSRPRSYRDLDAIPDDYD
jgi:ribonuclease E